jgi:hypothetical protein
MAVAKTLAYYNMAKIASLKSFIVQIPGAFIIKHYNLVMYEFCSINKIASLQLIMFIFSTLRRNLGPYSQNFIFLVT